MELTGNASLSGEEPCFCLGFVAQWFVYWYSSHIDPGFDSKQKPVPSHSLSPLACVS